MGKSKIDKTRRISLIKEVADLFEITDGEYVQFFIEGEQIVISKETRDFDGYDFEKRDIEDRIFRKGKQLSGDTSFFKQEEADADENDRFESAYEKYLKWKADKLSRQENFEG